MQGFKVSITKRFPDKRKLNKSFSSKNQNRSLIGTRLSDCRHLVKTTQALQAFRALVQNI